MEPPGPIFLRALDYPVGRVFRLSAISSRKNCRLAAYYQVGDATARAPRPLPFLILHFFIRERVMANKAHAAVVRRLIERYGTGAGNSNGFDVHIGDLIIEVETTATLLDAVEK